MGNNGAMTATWSAPGRVNLIGEHVDYNDGLVLPFALAFVTTTRVSAREDGVVHASSAGRAGTAVFGVDTQPGDVDGWAAYVAGVVWALVSTTVTEPPTRKSQAPAISGGMDIEITSDLPVGAGLSSSAALECAVAAAVGDEFDLRLDRGELAAAARKAENEYVGAPTGVMDQLASMLCEPGHAMLLDCRSLEATHIPFEPAGADLRLLVIDTRAEHALIGSEYADRRATCEAAAAELGLAALRDATLQQVRSLTDSTQLRRAQHVVTEIQRVRDVAGLLVAGCPQDIGPFLSASHESLRDDYEVSSEELDVAVESALAAGALGARLTGGGFAGCVIALARVARLVAVVDRVEAAFTLHGWRPPHVWVVAPSRGAFRRDEAGATS